MCEIDAKDVYYRDLNRTIREKVKEGERDIVLDNVCGQYYIACGIRNPHLSITINGVPGNDLCAFMNGPTVIVNDNAQDGVGNTMDGGKVIIYGSAGDVLGYSMRGGTIYVEKDVGYRCCIHMKAYKDATPTVVIGGCSGAFLGEYMAGGYLILLGLTRSPTKHITGRYLATGMHGGAIFIRGGISKDLCWPQTQVINPSNEDYSYISYQVKEFCNLFKIDYNKVMDEGFVKVIPRSTRPYEHLYVPGP